MEREKGIEPSRLAWEASRLPLHHSRLGLTVYGRLLGAVNAKLGFVHRERGSSSERQGIGEAVDEGAGDFDDLIGRW